MRDFEQIRKELNLAPFVGSFNGNLFVVPVAQGAPRIVVRRFDRDLRPALVPAYANLLRSASAWIERDPELARVVRLEQPTEIGTDFIARPHRLGTSLSAYFDDEDPPEPPDELAVMQSHVRELAAAAKTPQDELIAKILARSTLEPSGKTFYSFPEEKFVIVDIKPRNDDLERWAELTGEKSGGQ
jgi:hypothetical protein